MEEKNKNDRKETERIEKDVRDAEKEKIRQIIWKENIRPTQQQQ